MEAKLFTIKCMTNLHVGSNTEDYDIIDKKVQKDPLSKTPIIQSSGLKGALREHFKHHVLFSAGTNEEGLRNKIFGSEKANRSGQPLMRAGFKILDAQLLFIPVRIIKGAKPFMLGTTKVLLKQLEEICKWTELSPLMNLTSADVKKNFTGNQKMETEYGEFNHYYECTIYNDVYQFVVIERDDLAAELFENLPVIARNKLDNGESKNLWYEEVVPRNSVFYSVVLDNKIYPEINLDSYFKAPLNEKIVQIGANASIGYGHCKINF